MHNPKAIVVVTAVKFAKAIRRFDANQDVHYFDFKDGTFKMNSGAGAVLALHDEYELFVHGNSEDAGKRLVELGLIDESRYFALNLADKDDAHILARAVNEYKKQSGLPVHLVHYGAASEAGSSLPDGSLGMSIWDTPAAAVHALIDANCVALINLLQALKESGAFENQSVTKIVSLTAIAAIRARAQFTLDNIQKAAGHALVRSLALELTPEKIYLSEIMVGSLDGGYYDNEKTLNTSVKSSAKLGYAYEPESKPVFTAEQVGDAVRYILKARSNVRELIIAPYGQYPQLGA
jgi:NAD(P)-dependent dehydrogenase (short-subunit alcohol dehydrogenase family)